MLRCPSLKIVFFSIEVETQTVSSPVSESLTASSEPLVRPQGRVVLLAVLVVVLAVVATLGGLFWEPEAPSMSVVSVHGEGVDLYGEGIYRNDSLFRGAGNRGTDAVLLAIGVPLPAIMTAGYRRGSLRKSLGLVGVFGWIL